MSENSEFETDLREMIERKQVVAVIGAGVSIATTSKAPTWRGLIESGIARCRTLGSTDNWCQLAQQMLATTDADMLLSAAGLVHEKLRQHGGGELACWLRDTFESIVPENPSVIQSLNDLGIPLLTTNYDHLIENVTEQKFVTWTDSRRMARVVAGDERRVLHLHGHWDEPESVVLGIRSYEAVKNSEYTQAVLRAIGINKRLLFVGCGDEGLADPNFGNFLTWLESIEVPASVEHRHYRLVREKDLCPPRGRLFPLAYGDDYNDLPAFLERLRPRRAEPEGPRKAPSRASARSAPSIIGYLKRLTEETASLTLLGMGRGLQIDLPISEVYVPLRTILARSMEQRDTEVFKTGRAEHEEDVELGSVFHKTAQLGERAVILLGEPGSGKTTGAQQMAWRLASGETTPEELGLPAGMVPVLLRFRRLSREALANKKDGLRMFLEDQTRCALAPDGEQAPANDLLSRSSGGLLWILDGLDEVIDPGDRKTVAGWIRKALSERPRDWFLVTCRFQGYFRDGVPLGRKFVEFNVRPLEDPQVKRFVRDWFAAAFKKLLGPGSDAEGRATAASTRLLEILSLPEYQIGRLRELRTNPLLLTILCIVFHEERKLPTGRAELYAHCIRVFLETWRQELYEADDVTPQKRFDARAAQDVLARVAWWMHLEQARTAAPVAELARQAGDGLVTVAESSELGRDGEKFLERMRDETGILALEGDGRCGFLHLSFQEYLAAEHAVERGYARELATRATQSWWREVALLSLRSSQPFCEKFFAEMLAVGIAENQPELAERCLSEARYVVLQPFLDALQQAPSNERQAAVLRLLRDRLAQLTPDQMAPLEALCRRLAESAIAADTQARGFAAEILVHLGIEPPVTAGPTLFVEEKSGMTFVPIPAGEFLMGSDEGADDEKPVHQVYIRETFWLGKYPVTNGQYARFLEAKGKTVRKPEYWDDRRFHQPEQPVVGVSWEEAMEFCEWIGGRLPTEAEWEYACRAGTTTEYNFGNDASKLGEFAWFNTNSGGQTQPVGTKKPNAWELYDMHGNVWEWCSDRYGTYAAEPIEDPGGPKSGSGRVIRGGGWGNGTVRCRSAGRTWSWPDYRSDVLGFRVALSAVR